MRPEAEPASDLLRTIKASEPAIVELASRLIGIPSFRPEHDERAVVTELQQAARTLGLPGGEIQAADPDRPKMPECRTVMPHLASTACTWSL